MATRRLRQIIARLPQGRFPVRISARHLARAPAMKKNEQVLHMIVPFSGEESQK
jgi:hypothetical protein